MIAHQHPVYLQFFTQGSIPPVFSLILHDGLMVSPSGSETHTDTSTPMCRGRFCCCALCLWDFGRRVRFLHLHTRIALLTACFRPPFHELRTRGPASPKGGYGVCPSPYTIFELGHFCFFWACATLHCQLVLILSSIRY